MRKLGLILGLTLILAIGLVSADTAVYNSTYGAPYCADETNQCNVPSSLIGGVANTEPNNPNTITSVTDINSLYGVFVNEILVESTNGNNITQGGDIDITAYIEGDVTGSDNRIFYTSDADNPSWTEIQNYYQFDFDTSVTMTKNFFTLDDTPGYHAIRVQSYGIGTEDIDRDDVVFYVQSSGTPEDTCTYSGTGNWTIDLTDNCQINTDYDLDTNEIILSNTGSVSFNSSINVTNFPEPATNQNIYIDSNAYIMVS